MAGKRRKWKPDPRRWARVRRQVFERDGWRCTMCGGPGALECHHVKHLRNGGAEYDPDNLAAVCRTCHIAHHRPDDMTPGRAEWLEFIQELAENV